jgi:hypothetical protein
MNTQTETATSTRSVLPDKASDLIEIALEDLEKIEKDPRYRIDMNKWHEPYQGPDGRPVCLVCFAGGVMASRLGIKPTEWACTTGPEAGKLDALDCFRNGDIESAYECLERENPLPDDDVTITPYCHYPEDFKSDMRNLAAQLRAAGD